MEFLKFIRSIEELLYEVMTWLLFYPRTMWRVLARPGSLIAETTSELGQDVEQQFTDLVSPPLFLMLSILLAHALELTAHIGAAPMKSELAQRVMASDTNLLIFRVVVFSLFPLVMAVGLLKRLKLPIDRETLRRPFYLQCFYAAPFAVFTSAGVTLARTHLPDPVRAAGLVLWLATTGWYLAVEANWFRGRLGVSLPRGFLIAAGRLALGFLLTVLAGLVLIGPAMA
ncbi:MAG: hypothetical protein J7521_10405 [Caulobacter sp.]|nr:hypothetical protein [Caulobacter sp.]